MLSRTPRKLVLGLAAAFLLLFALPAGAQADALVDLVRSAGDAPSPRVVSGKAGARKSLRKAGRKSLRGKQARKAPRRGRAKIRTPRLELTAAQRGSGTIDTLDLSGPVSLDEGPAIEPKGGLGFAPRR